MKHSKIIAASVILLSGSLIPAESAIADDGWYVGGSIGKGYVDESIDGLQFKADSTAFRVFAGYSLNDHFAVEAGYLDLGTYRDAIDIGGIDVPVSANADGFTIAAAGKLPISEHLSALARIGFYFSDGQSTTAGITENDPSEQNPFIGIGLGYSLSENIDANVSADYFDLDAAQPWLASVGITVRF